MPVVAPIFPLIVNSGTAARHSCCATETLGHDRNSHLAELAKRLPSRTAVLTFLSAAVHRLANAGGGGYSCNEGFHPSPPAPQDALECGQTTSLGRYPCV